MPLQLNINLDQKSARALRSALNKVPLELQEKAGKKALRTFGGRVTRIARPRIDWRKTAKSLKSKIKKYKDTLWLGVGSKISAAPVSTAATGGRARRRAYDEFSPGWRSHWEELGFHTWQKGWQRTRRSAGRGWKKGLKHRGRGVFHRGSKALTTAFNATASQFRPIVANAIDKYLESKRR